jgi:hypothetical protein
MSGSSSGLCQTTIVGARVATGKNNTTGRETELLYTPPYLRAGDQKFISAKCQIPCLVNIYGRTEPDHFRLVAWGGRADLFAKNLNKGKEMHWMVVPRSYWSDLFFSDGVQIMDRNGQPKTVRQQSYTIVDFAWGSDSAKTEYEEMTIGIKSGEGLRPQNWRIQGHADNLMWTNLLAARKALSYNGGDRYGFAKVIYPKGGGLILLGDMSPSAARAAGGQVNLIQQATAAGRVLQVGPGQNPVATGQPGGTMVVGAGAAPTETLIHTALTTGIKCASPTCVAQLAAGQAFCQVCGTPAPIAGAVVNQHVVHPNAAATAV